MWSNLLDQDLCNLINLHNITQATYQRILGHFLDSEKRANVDSFVSFFFKTKQ